MKYFRITRAQFFYTIFKQKFQFFHSVKESKNEVLDKVEEVKDEYDEKSSSWCPPVFFNYKCYSASFLSRTRLAGLPKKIGPGPVQLVIREVLNLIIGSSFKSGSVLKRLEAKNETAKVDFVIEELKGKSRVLNLKANIEIPTKTHQVDKYLREMCQKLSACPNMVATKLYQGVCPVDCHNRPKTEFREDDGQNVKSEAPKVPRKRGKKRKHPDALLVEKANLPSSSDDSSSSRPSSPTGKTFKIHDTFTFPKKSWKIRQTVFTSNSFHFDEILS